MMGQAVLHGLPDPKIALDTITIEDPGGSNRGMKSIGFQLKVVVPAKEKFSVSDIPDQADVDDVLRICAEKEVTWGELYKIWEYLKKATNPVNKGWVSKTQIGLFTHTANSQAALGIEGRHDHQTKLHRQDP